LHGRWKCGLNGKARALRVGGSEFKPWSTTPQQKKEKKKVAWDLYKNIKENDL
jgi:hypothetical protein